MVIDQASVDEALTTTRAVRLRLDLERPVDDQIIFDCIDVAEQAPTGGNQGSRRWVIVRDQAQKERLAELYMKTGGTFMLGARDQLAGSGHPQERVMRSAAHLAENLARVPAIVVPTIIGRHDGSGRPGLFDSVIQAVWSFCVALRARGLGTAWTTAILGEDEQLAEVLGVPGENTQIAMVPVAWTKGTEFKRAPRYPARAIAFVDTYGHTWEAGPSDPPQLSDGPGAVAEIDVKARSKDVWTALAPGLAELGASDDDLQREPVGTASWVTGSPHEPAARWRAEVEALAGSSRVRLAMAFGPGAADLQEAVASESDRSAELVHAAVGHELRAIRAVLADLAARLGEG